VAGDEEGADLAGGFGVPGEPGVRVGEHEVVGHAGEARAGDGDFAVVGAGEESGEEGVERAVGGDDAEGGRGRGGESGGGRGERGPRAEGAGEIGGGGAEAAAVGAGEPAEGRKGVEAVGEFAAGVGRGEHHDVAEVGGGAVVAEPEAHEDAAHRVGDEVDAGRGLVGRGGERSGGGGRRGGVGGDRSEVESAELLREPVVGERFEWDAAGRVVEVDDAVAVAGEGGGEV